MGQDCQCQGPFTLSEREREFLSLIFDAAQYEH